jgi:hypothetical protein
MVRKTMSEDIELAHRRSETAAPLLPRIEMELVNSNKD